MKKSNLNDIERKKLQELIEILTQMDPIKMYNHYKLSLNDNLD